MLQDRPLSITRALIAVERWATWPLRRDPDSAYTNYLTPLTRGRLDEITESVAKGVLAELIEPAMFRVLLDRIEDLRQPSRVCSSVMQSTADVRSVAALLTGDRAYHRFSRS